MNNKNVRSFVFYIIALISPALASAEKFEFNGHTYELVIAEDISWDSAKAAAEASMLGGTPGHLATITSAAENDFLFSLIAPPILAAFPGKSEAWIGGSQPSGTDWEWVNGEGMIPPSGQSTNPYANWHPGEPNNLGVEDHMTLGRFDDTDPFPRTWNDSKVANGHIGGYLVEWDSVVEAEECQDPEGCNPSGVQTVVLPPSVVLEEGDTLTQALVERQPGVVGFLDPRVDALGQCFDRRELDVFLELGGGTPGALVLPEFLCGSPEFAIVRSDATFEILQDVVRSEQFPEDIFTETFDCDGAPGDTDLQRRNVFAWQPDDLADVIENRTVELTNDCGSSRGATKGLSWFVLNLHIDCGIAFGTNDGGVEFCLRIITNQKFIALGIAIINAAPALSRADFRAISRAYLRAYIRFLIFRYGTSVANLTSFLALVEGAAFDLGGDNNDQGELLMRGENIRFTIDAKLDP